MKTLSAALKSHYAKGTTTLATCWKATLLNGTVICATSLDRDIVFDGLTYKAAQGYTISDIESSADLNPDNLEIDGVLASPAITDSDIYSGLWDYAAIEIFEVNYADLSQGKNVLRSGTLGEVRGGRSKFVAEMRGLMQAFTRTIGRIIIKECPADLGDSRCKIDLAPLTKTGAVESVSSNRIISDAARIEAADWFTGGKLTFTSGANSGRSMEVKKSTPGQLELTHAMFDVIAAGDTYSVYAGCTKRFSEDCVGKFSNGVNFRGFPHLPGTRVYQTGGIDYGTGTTLLASSGTGTGTGTGGGTGGGTPAPGTRDPLLWPFAAESIWNMPIGAGAVYVPAEMTGTPNGGNIYAHMPGIDGEHICLTPTAPLTQIKYSSAGWSGASRCAATSSSVLASVPMPADYIVPSTSTNSAGVFLAADGRTIIQVQPLARCNPSGIGTAMVRMDDQDIYGMGAGGAHGGSGLSSIGGSIRMGELRPGQTGPKHALKVNVYAKEFLYPTASRATGYRWPATTCDSYAVGWYGAENGGGPPAMKMGALLALHPSADISAMGLETEPGRQIAWTLQNYGAYIVDDAYAAGFDISVEDGPGGSKAAEFAADYGYPMEQRIVDNTAWVRDIQRLCAALYVVDNNSATSIGGGGTPRQPLAPPFA